jgi:hypothetical protein
MIGEELERAGHPKCVIGPVRECCMANGWLGGGGRQSRGAKRRDRIARSGSQQSRHDNTSNTNHYLYLEANYYQQQDYLDRGVASTPLPQKTGPGADELILPLTPLYPYPA